MAMFLTVPGMKLVRNGTSLLNRQEYRHDSMGASNGDGESEQSSFS
jgi:hypothetical protein